MSLALRTSDPSVLHKCWLFLGLSAMQQGRLRIAKRIVVKVHHSNINRGHQCDKRVQNMCHGIWNRLKYEYVKRKSEKISHNGYR